MNILPGLGFSMFAFGILQWYPTNIFEFCFHNLGNIRQRDQTTKLYCNIYDKLEQNTSNIIFTTVLFLIDLTKHSFVPEGDKMTIVKL